MFRYKILPAVLLLALAAGGNSARAFSDLPQDKFPPVLAAVQAAGLTPVKQFEAVGGLRGWVMANKKTDENTIVFTTENGEILVAGIVVDAKGRNLTALYAEEHLPQMDYSPAFKGMSAGGAAAAAVVGSPKAKAEISVMFDVNCGYCKLLHRLLKPSIDAGELRVRYVPVAIMAQDSASVGAGLLAAKSPGESLDKLVNGTKPDAATDPALLEKVKANTALMTKYHFKGTPAVLYTDKTGTLQVSPGLPNYAQMVERLGIPSHAAALTKADPGVSMYLQ